MDVMANTFVKWPQVAKREKEIYKMNKLNENAMRTHEHATHGMTNITFKKVIILEEANIMQLFTLLHEQLVLLKTNKCF
jgi:hypothetical protein